MIGAKSDGFMWLFVSGFISLRSFMNAVSLAQPYRERYQDGSCAVEAFTSVFHDTITTNSLVFFGSLLLFLPSFSLIAAFWVE